MSPTNADVVLEGMHAINRRDAGGFVACLHPEIEWVETGDVFPGLRGVHRGRDGARKWFAEAILDPWEEMRVECEEISEVGDGRILGGFSATARGRASGVETELRFWSIFAFADGEIARREVFWNRDDAVAAADG